MIRLPVETLVGDGGKIFPANSLRGAKGTADDRAEPPGDADYWEVQNLYLYRVRINPRTPRFSIYEPDIEMPP